MNRRIRALRASRTRLKKLGVHIAHYIPSVVPALRYGGTERVAFWAAEEHARAGCRVTILSHRGSHVPFGSWKILPESESDWRSTLAEDGPDLVHFHSLPPKTFPMDFPHIVTIHGNGRPDEVFPRNSVFVSRDHARRHGSETFVHNGIRLDLYPLKKSREISGDVLFLAKASWRVKNLRGAIGIAREAKHRLLVAGGHRPLAPWGLLATNARFFGQVDDALKIRLLHRSDALLFPVLWQEPFGLAVIEALACGLPVVASAFGALPEIVTSECGLLGTTAAGMSRFLEHGLAAISPEACRARVEAHFTAARMAQAYLDLYRKVLAGNALNPRNPRTIADNSVCSLDLKKDVLRSR